MFDAVQDDAVAEQGALQARKTILSYTGLFSPKSS